MQSLGILTGPVDSAKAAGLRYVSDAKPGIRRKHCGKGFRYLGIDGAPMRDPEVLARIKSLAIPPAWIDVWICPNPNGHLQATGRDARGRKQSRYHSRWREVRDETKYERMMLFGEALPAIRERVEHDLARPGLPREKVLATIVRLMETTYIRVGNVEYARENHSYGLTTMRDKHVDVDGSTVQFKFQGKSGVHHTVDVNDRRVVRVIKRCLDIPGYELFQYLDSEGQHHTVDSGDVNDYLREITNQHFTAKDFRTWAGTLLAFITLKDFESFESENQGKKNVVQVIATVAKLLGNTPSVCRKCYVHPAVPEFYLRGGMSESGKRRVERKMSECAEALQQEEAALMHLLRQRVVPEKS